MVPVYDNTSDTVANSSKVTITYITVIIHIARRTDGPYYTPLR